MKPLLNVNWSSSWQAGSVPEAEMRTPAAVSRTMASGWPENAHTRVPLPAQSTSLLKATLAQASGTVMVCLAVGLVPPRPADISVTW